MDRKISILILLLLCVILAGTASASSISNSTNSFNTTNNHLKLLNHTDVVSGNVTKCNNGKPFQGVTVTVKSINGTLISKTTTDVNGYYILKFSNNALNYSVTASYPGHVPSTKKLTLQKVLTSNKTIIYYASANFKLGPMPSLSITAPSSQLLNQTFNFNLIFSNTGNETGFGPMVQLYYHLRLNSTVQVSLVRLLRSLQH